MITSLKFNRACKLAGIHAGPVTRQHILRNIQERADLAVLGQMSSKQLAVVIASADYSFHDGRASKGDVDIADGCVWVGAGVDKLIPLPALRAMTVTKTSEPMPPQAGWPQMQNRDTRYSMDFTERC